MTGYRYGPYHDGPDPLASPYDATVRAVHVQEGDRVAGGAVLVELDD